MIGIDQVDMASDPAILIAITETNMIIIIRGIEERAKAVQKIVRNIIIIAIISRKGEEKIITAGEIVICDGRTIANILVDMLVESETMITESIVIPVTRGIGRLRDPSQKMMI